MNFKYLLKTLFLLLCFLQVSLFNDAYAQGAEGGGGEDIYGESLKDVTTVAAIGLGGAILGLSTLSFVDEPKDHLKNIVVGGAIGVIIGVGVVAWTQANKSKDLYEQNAYLYNPKAFDTSKRLSWHSNSQDKNFSKKNIIQGQYLNYSFSF